MVTANPPFLPVPPRIDATVKLSCFLLVIRPSGEAVLLAVLSVAHDDVLERKWHGCHLFRVLFFGTDRRRLLPRRRASFGTCNKG